MSKKNNMNELLDLLNNSNDNLNTNLKLENDIRNNGATILYSYNNIIIASEINDMLYNNLKTDNNIEFIQELPLKKYGDIDINLIDQIVDNNIVI